MPDPLIEDAGLIKVHSVCAAMAAIWRPTTSHDLGIDGQIEFLIPGTSTSTGDILAVQCKSGHSYFKHQDPEFVYLYPQSKHRRYWRILKLPVILVLHDPTTDTTLYTSLKPQLGARAIRIEKNNLFLPESRAAIQACCEPDQFDPATVLDRLADIRVVGRTITGIELLLACTNREHSYFELRMCRVSALFEVASETPSFSIGTLDYDFILRNIFAVLDTGLTEDFREQFDRGWFELEVVPDIIVPLTNRGRAVLDVLWNNPERHVSTQQYAHLATDAKGIATTISATAQAASDHLDRSDRLGIEPRG